MIRLFCVLTTMCILLLTAAGCMSPQERTGYSSRPYNSPASWEINPYGDMFQN